MRSSTSFRRRIFKEGMQGSSATPTVLSIKRNGESPYAVDHRVGVMPFRAVPWC